MNVLILSAFGFDAVHMVEFFYKALKFKRFSKASLYLDLRVLLAFKTSKKNHVSFLLISPRANLSNLEPFLFAIPLKSLSFQILIEVQTK